MRAFVMRSIDAVEFVEKPVPRPGPGVRRFKPGDRVVVGAITTNWGDPASQAGHPSQSAGALGGWKFANAKDGVFAEYFHVNEADANMASIPDAVSDEKAVYCADMISTGFAAAENAAIPMGGTVAVFAEGPIGLMATVGARLSGAGWGSAWRRKRLRPRCAPADVCVWSAYCACSKTDAWTPRR